MAKLLTTTLIYQTDDFLSCLVVACCKRGPIDNDVKYCPFCGKEIVRSKEDLIKPKIMVDLAYKKIESINGGLRPG